MMHGLANVKQQNYICHLRIYCLDYAVVKCKAVKVQKCDFVLAGELEYLKLWVKHRLRMMRMV